MKHVRTPEVAPEHRSVGAWWGELHDGAGYDFDRLAAPELAAVRRMIAEQYLGRLGDASPPLRDEAAKIGIDRYHTLNLPFDHAAFWSKDKRVLDRSTHRTLCEMGFFRRIRQVLPSAQIFPDDLMWRIVRPNAATDVGPVHADKWFWDIGHGSISAEMGRFKVWTAVFAEPGLNGLCIKERSHRSDAVNHRFELRDGKLKPVVDETPEELGMELLLLKPGEMIFFHDALLHGGVVNRGQACRVSIEMTIVYPLEEGERALTPRRKAA